MLAPSAFLASAAGSSHIARLILPAPLKEVPIHHQSVALDHWRLRHKAGVPSGPNASHQKAWETPLVEASLSALIDGALSPRSPIQSQTVSSPEKRIRCLAYLYACIFARTVDGK